MSAVRRDRNASKSASRTGPAVVEATKLGLTFETNDGPVHALTDVDLTIGKGEFVSFIGPSGCGKTTFLRVIADLEQPTAGTIIGQRHDARTRRARRAPMAMSSRRRRSIPGARSRRNVALPLEIMGYVARPSRPSASSARWTSSTSTGFGKKYPWQLSGGMQQRASIARALAFDADLLLMDEPFGALDEIVRDHLNEQLLKLWARTDKTICFVTHSIPEAVYLSTEIVVMSPAARPGHRRDRIDAAARAAARHPRDAGIPGDRRIGCARACGRGTAMRIERDCSTPAPSSPVCSSATIAGLRIAASFARLTNGIVRAMARVKALVDRSSCC